MRWLVIVIAFLLLPGAAGARCAGVDLLPGLPEAERAGMVARAEAVPFPRGNLWRAERGDAVLHVAGTFHIGDARMGPVMRGLAPLIEASALVLVEVTEAEEAELQAQMVADPGLGFITEPPTLRDLLDDEEWRLYAAEMEARGVPGFLAARFRPWLAFTTLTIPACLMAGDGPPPGLDERVMTHARGVGVPVAPLEGAEVLFALFELFSAEEEMDILRATLLQAELSEDVFATLAAAYFAGEHRLIWEFGRSWMPPAAADLWPPERVGPLYDRMEELLLVRRNRAWMGAILEAAEAGPVFVAVGAAHLSGHDGLLDLLAGEGFALTRLD